MPGTRWRGVLLLLLLLGGGRLIRRHLMLGPDGAWRDPAWLDRWIAPAAAAAPPARRRRGPARTVTPAHPLSVNLVPAESLTALPGVGPVLAGRIVAERERGGPFLDPDDLVRVRGIGPATAARLGPLLDFTTAADSSSDGGAGR